MRTLRLRKHCVELPLHDLSAEAVSRYLEARFPGADFPPTLARLIHAHTDGQPLFVVATVDHMVSQGWILDTAPGWALCKPIEAIELSIPDGVRRAIAAELQRTSPTDRSLLQTASVGGTEFAAQIVAAAQGTTVDEVEQRCEAFARAQRILSVSGATRWPDGSVARRYRFTHELYRQVLYEDIPEEQRGRLHGSIGAALERVYGAHAADIAPELAVHFERACDAPRALRYLTAAGLRASQRFARREAIQYFEAALAQAAHLPDTGERQRAELEVRMILGRALGDLYGFGAEVVRTNYRRTSELCETVGSAAELFESLYARWFLYGTRAEGEQTSALLARRMWPAVYLRSSLRYSWIPPEYARPFGGDVSRKRDSASARCWAGWERPEAALPAAYGPDPVIAATTHYAVAQWFLGDTAGARASARAALARARDSGNAYSRCAALVVCAWAYLLARNLREGLPLAERAFNLSAEEGFAMSSALASALRGWARVQQGRAAEGCDEIRCAMASLEATGEHFFSIYLHAFLAEGQLRLGTFADGLTTADAGLDLVEKGFDCGCPPELWRLKGELLLAAAAKGRRSPRGGQARERAARVAAAAWPEAERCLRQALDLARASSAKSLELRAATSLARAWRAHGRAAEARTVLVEICDWFGVDPGNADLLEARALLGDLVAAH